jgi:hypothetical protein
VLGGASKEIIVIEINIGTSFRSRGAFGLEG